VNPRYAIYLSAKTRLSHVAFLPYSTWWSPKGCDGNLPVQVVSWGRGWGGCCGTPPPHVVYCCLAVLSAFKPWFGLPLTEDKPELPGSMWVVRHHCTWKCRIT
jgi:hypothetical protein